MTTAFQNNAFQTSAFQIDAVSGVIYAIDQNDTASLSGSVTSYVEVHGNISATDQNDVATILGTITSSFVPDTHDGFTQDDIRRAREIDKKIAKARLKLFEAQKTQKLARKQAIRELVDPSSKVVEKQQSVVESQQIDKNIALEKVIKASAAVKKLEEQRKALFKEIKLREEQAQIMTELAILRAKQLDEDEAILALLM